MRKVNLHSFAYSYDFCHEEINKNKAKDEESQSMHASNGNFGFLLFTFKIDHFIDCTNNEFLMNEKER
jgi:hypothetical protein